MRFRLRDTFARPSGDDPIVIFWTGEIQSGGLAARDCSCARKGVRGHEKVLGYGHLRSPLVATKVPAFGHEKSPPLTEVST